VAILTARAVECSIDQQCRRGHGVWLGGRFVAACLIGAAGCASNGPPSRPSGRRNAKPVEASARSAPTSTRAATRPRYPRWSIRRRLSRVTRAARRQLAIVLDIDETRAVESASLRAKDYGFIISGRVICRADRGGLLAWIGMARAEPIKPVLTSPVWPSARRGRSSPHRTSGRLRQRPAQPCGAAGYEWTGVLLKPDALTTQSAVEFKAPERKKLVDQGYTIIGKHGGIRNERSRGRVRRATYKLPNPFYFVPWGTHHVTPASARSLPAAPARERRSHGAPHP